MALLSLNRVSSHYFRLRVIQNSCIKNIISTNFKNYNKSIEKPGLFSLQKSSSVYYLLASRFESIIINRFGLKTVYLLQ